MSVRFPGISFANTCSQTSCAALLYYDFSPRYEDTNSFLPGFLLSLMYYNWLAAPTGICRMFEKKLKELNPNIKSITYDISDLYRYIDTFVSILPQPKRSAMPLSLLLSGFCGETLLTRKTSCSFPSVPKPDISTLIQDKGPNSYSRFDKEWIKTKIYNHLRRQAT